MQLSLSFLFVPWAMAFLAQLTQFSSLWLSYLQTSLNLILDVSNLKAMPFPLLPIPFAYQIQIGSTHLVSALSIALASTFFFDYTSILSFFTNAQLKSQYQIVESPAPTCSHLPPPDLPKPMTIYNKSSKARRQDISFPTCHPKEGLTNMSLQKQKQRSPNPSSAPNSRICVNLILISLQVLPFAHLLSLSSISTLLASPLLAHLFSSYEPPLF